MRCSNACETEVKEAEQNILTLARLHSYLYQRVFLFLHKRFDMFSGAFENEVFFLLRSREIRI